MSDTPGHIHALSAAMAMTPGTSATTSLDVMLGSAKGAAVAVQAPKGSGINLGALCCTHSTRHGILFPFSLCATLCCFSPDRLRCAV